MGKLVYEAIMSVDGYIADADGGFDWAVPSDELHGFINDRMRAIGTHLYGRNMYETMSGWETDTELAESSPLMRDFAQQWQAADKVVYSTTLAEVVTSRTRLESSFEPDAVRELKESTDRDLVIGGANLAASAFAAGLVDRCDLFRVPCLVGGGSPGLPPMPFARLELMAEHRFDDGTRFTGYAVR